MWGQMEMNPEDSQTLQTSKKEVANDIKKKGGGVKLFGDWVEQTKTERSKKEILGNAAWWSPSLNCIIVGLIQ